MGWQEKMEVNYGRFQSGDRDGPSHPLIVQTVVFGPKKGGRDPGEDDQCKYGEKPTDKPIEEDDSDVPF